jgi:hypothetical protein
MLVNHVNFATECSNFSLNFRRCTGTTSWTTRKFSTAMPAVVIANIEQLIIEVEPGNSVIIDEETYVVVC